MSNLEFTPGPWQRRGTSIYGTNRDLRSKYEGQVECIASIVDGWEQDRGKANARLIASAPELLEALETIHDFPADENSDPDVMADALNQIFAIANQAIAKVTKND